MRINFQNLALFCFCFQFFVSFSKALSLRMSSFTRLAQVNPHRFQWQQTMLRIKDPARSVPFYERLSMRLIHKYDFPQWKFSLFFMATIPEGKEGELPAAGTAESESMLWKFDGVTLELTHNWGTESDPTYKVNNGNVEPYRGFGHIAVMTPDVYKACEELERDGVAFQKRPDEGRMKGIAFALDPDGYWVECVPRSPQSTISNKFTLAQTMFRVKDPVKSLRFYRDLLGMTLLRVSHHSDFSLYFLAHIPQGETVPDPESPEASEYIKNMFGPVIELIHNHGTETKESFSYHNGNDEDPTADPPKIRGFGHTGFLVDDLDAACAFLESEGVKFKKKPAEGNMRGLAFAYDPDNYWVEIIQRGGLSMIENK